MRRLLFAFGALVTLSVGAQTLTVETGWGGEAFGAAVGARFEARREVGGSFRPFVAEVAARAEGAGSACLDWTFDKATEGTREGVWLKLDAVRWAGSRVVYAGHEVTLPTVHEPGKNIHLATGEAMQFAFLDADGREVFALAFDETVACHAMDEREWNQETFVWRFWRPCAPNAKPFVCRLHAEGGVSVAHRAPHVIEVGPDWCALAEDASDVVPGSALDFTTLCGERRPCGTFGRVLANGGDFVFADRPNVRVRFYGVNICSDAVVTPHRDVIEAFTDRLARRGYNALRFHHHDGPLSEGTSDAALNPRQLEKMDVFMDACGRKGLYVTTDVFVSRKVPWRAIGENRDGVVGMDAFKALVLVHEGAYSNLCAFARDWLTHVNVVNGRRWADDPTLAFLAFVNEGHLGMDGLETLNELPRYPEAWRAWGGKGVIPAGRPWDKTADAARVAAFLANLEMKFAVRFSTFLRRELGVKALLTDMSSGMEREEFRPVRTSAAYDYVDEHFYWDHPAFPKTAWALPAQSLNANPIRSHGADVLADAARVRLPDKPFAVSEWNFTGPSAYRSMAGLVMGAEACRENWGAAWRFDWGGSPWELAKPHEVRAGFFGLAGDPLARATERAVVCLFLRGDGEGAEVSADRATGAFSVRSPRLCGGFSETGVLRCGALAARGAATPMTVWASALDGLPLDQSRRILVAHLTDLQNTGATYKDATRTVVLSWGRPPHLVRRASARIGLAVAKGRVVVYALDLAGRRVKEVPSARSGKGILSWTADPAQGDASAVLYYEIVRADPSSP